MISTKIKIAFSSIAISLLLGLAAIEVQAARYGWTTMSVFHDDKQFEYEFYYQSDVLPRYSFRYGFNKRIIHARKLPNGGRFRIVIDCSDLTYSYANLPGYSENQSYLMTPDLPWYNPCISK